MGHSAKLSAEVRDREQDLFTPLPGLNEGINQNACQSERAGGLCLDNLKVGDLLELETKTRTYFIENRGNGQILISGHPKYCPQPTPVELYGSTWGGIILKPGFIGRHMSLAFRHPQHGVIRTSRIQEIRRLSQAPQSGRQLVESTV
jgi:hypothetical protein